MMYYYWRGIRISTQTCGGHKVESDETDDGLNNATTRIEEQFKIAVEMDMGTR
jgi:hypothetical protein